MTEPNTLDEQIRKACTRLGLNMENEDNLEFEAEIKALFTEHSKQARIDELESFYTTTPSAKSEWIDDRIAQLKRNKGEDNE